MEMRDNLYNADFNSLVEIRIQWDDLGQNPGHFREKDQIESAISQLNKLKSKMQYRLQHLQNIA